MYRYIINSDDVKLLARECRHYILGRHVDAVSAIKGYTMIVPKGLTSPKA